MIRFCISKIQQYWLSTKIKIIFVSVVLLLNGRSFAQDFNGWIKVDSLLELRYEPGIVKLPNGNILVSGGEYDGIALSTCEIYDASLNQWRYTAPMNIAREFHTTILLNTNKVLAIGGFGETSCEIFDPETELWSVTGSFSHSRWYSQSITKLQDGRILLCGGFNTVGDPMVSEYLNICEIYNPQTGLWETAASMITGRADHCATLLNDGRVLVTGGSSKNDGILATCELYDPSTDTWNIVSAMNNTRTHHASILLPNGSVFVCGGAFPWSKSCEIYNIDSDTWTMTSDMEDYREFTSLYLLPEENELLIFGGAALQDSEEDTWEKFNIENMTNVKYGLFPTTKLYSNNAIMLDDDRIMLIGGQEIDASSGQVVITISKSCFILDNISPVENLYTIPREFLLFQNYPNPFNPTTTIEFDLAVSSKVTLKIYNILGEEVRTLIDDYRSAGKHRIMFDAYSAYNGLSSGIYIYSLTASKKVMSGKMLLNK